MLPRRSVAVTVTAARWRPDPSQVLFFTAARVRRFRRSTSFLRLPPRSARAAPLSLYFRDLADVLTLPVATAAQKLLQRA